MDENEANEKNKNLPVKSVNASSLIKFPSKTSVLDRIHADAFSIVSSLSVSERTIGAWVINKDDYNRLLSFYDKMDSFRNLGPEFVLCKASGRDDRFNYECPGFGKTFEEFASRHVYETTDKQLAMSWGYSWLLHPTCPKDARKERDQLLEISRNWIIDVKSILRLNDIDRECKFLNYPFYNNDSLNSVSSEELDFSHLKKLELLRCNSIDVRNIFLNECKDLKILDCSHNKIDDLELKNNLKLHYLNCSYNKLRKIELPENLEELNCSHNQMKILSVPTNIFSLECAFNRLEKLDLNDCLKLELLDIESNQISQLNFINNTQINILSCEQNKLDQINLSNCKDSLVDIKCDYFTKVIEPNYWDEDDEDEDEDEDNYPQIISVWSTVRNLICTENSSAYSSSKPSNSFAEQGKMKISCAK